MSIAKLNMKLLLIIFFILGSSYLTSAKNSDKIFSYPWLISQQEDPYLPFAEVMPEPVGGLNAIYKKIQYPAIARNAGLEGKVYLLVFINETGGVDQVKVIKGIGGGCDEAAVDAVKSVKYTPGKNKGAAVKVKLSLAIIFKAH